MRLAVGRLRQTTTWASHFLRDLLECRVLPRIAGILPWRHFFLLSRFLCTFPYLFEAEARAGVAGAKAFGYVDNSFIWLRNHRFVRLVDQVDASISAHCDDSWLDEHMEIDGEWPTVPFVGITFHFGAGLWAIRHLHRKAIPSSFLSALLQPDMFPGHPLRYAFEVGRMAEVERVAGRPIIYVGGSFDKLQAALTEGTSIIGLIDVLPQFVPITQAVTFLGRESRFPNGLIHLARHCQVPLAVFICYPSVETGRRKLAIRQIDASNPDPLAAIIGTLENAISTASWAWHLWPIARDFFRSSDDGEGLARNPARCTI